MRAVLAIAGHDPTSGAGITLDAAALRSVQCYPLTALTALTVQDTRGVRSYTATAPELFREQLRTVCADIYPDGVKIGMLPSDALAREVMEYLEETSLPVVLDPVLAASSGDDLASEDPVTRLAALAPHVSLLTPNLHEAGVLLGRSVATPAEIDEAAWDLLEWGFQAVLIKGGHRLDGPTDLLVTGDAQRAFPGEWIDGPPVHGTGCALSSLIAGLLAQGFPLEEAVGQAKGLLAERIPSAQRLGGGQGLLVF